MSVVEAPRTRPDRLRPERAGSPAARPNLHVVGPPRRRRTRLVAFIVLIMVSAVLLATVAFHVRLVQQQQHIDRLNRQADAAQARYDRLRVEVDRLESPARIVSTAKKLGMVDPAESTWLAPAHGASVNDASPSGGSGATSPDDYPDVKPHLGIAP